MSWSLVTASDERERCCVVEDGARCERSTEFEIRGAGGELDDYTFTCIDQGCVRGPRADPLGRVGCSLRLVAVGIASAQGPDCSAKGAGSLPDHRLHAD
jgi:hypothetical protein